jgi:hypothetical protein
MSSKSWWRAGQFGFRPYREISASSGPGVAALFYPKNIKGYREDFFWRSSAVPEQIYKLKKSKKKSFNI